MSGILDLLYPLKGSYSGAFVALWFTCVLSATISLFFRKKHWSTYFDVGAYWVLALLMVAFAVLRPIGIARDDLAYVEIFNSICPTLTCGQWIQGTRDWGWYSLVGLLKSVLPTPRVMLGVAALALLVKLWVIFRLTRYPLMALLLFTGVFYQMQDLTAFRVSLSLAFLMLAIWVYVTRGGWVGNTAFVLPGLFHKQGFLTIGLVMAPLFRQKFWLLPILIVVPFFSLWVFGKPPIPMWLINPEDTLTEQAVRQGLDAYIAGYAAGVFQQDKLIPWALYPVAALGLWLAKDVFERNRDLYSVVAASMAIACGLMWFFAAMTAAQVRFFEFFMLSIVLLAGEAKRSWLTLVLITAVAGAYVFRFNVLHPLLM